MKKYLFILGLVGTALFTACSTSDDLVADKPIETSPDDQASITTLIAEARQDSEVPITLGVNQGRGNTRKPIGGESNNPTYVSFDTEPGKYIGVFCLATGYQSSYASNPPIDNNWTDNDDTGLLVRMKNVPATVIDGKVAFYNHARTSGQNYYYPMGDWMKYNFYAYYPWQDEEEDDRTLVFKNNRVLEKYYDIDGSQDIIWGIADPESAEPVASSSAKNAAPYSAKYIRMKKAEPEITEDKYIPKLKFKHKLVQFRFFVKAAKATDAEEDHTIRENLIGLNAKVMDMYIGNAINRLMLVVADTVQNEEKNTDGTLYWFGNTLNTKKLGIKTNGLDTDRFPGTAIPEDGDTDGYLDWVDAITDYSNPVGYILLAPPTVRGVNTPGVANNHVYQLYLKVQYNSGTGTDTNVVALSLNPPSGGFEAGKIYNIVANVQSPEQISATAVLLQWGPGSTIPYGNE